MSIAAPTTSRRVGSGEKLVGEEEELKSLGRCSCGGWTTVPPITTPLTHEIGRNRLAKHTVASSYITSDTTATPGGSKWGRMEPSPPYLMNLTCIG